jgi:hypothetical protein
MVKYMLKIRYSDLAKKKYSCCKGNKGKNEWWRWLTDRFNDQFFTEMTVIEIQNRGKRFLTEYNQIVGAEKATGNCKPINYPEYWEDLLSKLKVQNKTLNETS